MFKKILIFIVIFMASLQAAQTQVLILLGPPGAGKGSQASLIKEKMEIAHISTGDLLRENIKQGTELGQKAKTFMDAGQLVPDELIFGMLFTRVEQPDCQKGYILDGFPRNLSQAEALQSRLNDTQVTAISLSIPDTEIVDRITKRQICKSCQTPYHLISSRPQKEGVCDKCGGDLYQRSDDTKEVVEERLRVYHAQTSPLIEYYGKQKTLHTVDSTAPKETVMKQILNVLGRR